jgi:hypothetical protein
MYLVFAIAAGVIGGAFSILIRMELQEPGLQIFSNPHYFNVVVSAHGLTMIFFVLMPALIGGFGNWIGNPRAWGHDAHCANSDSDQCSEIARRDLSRLWSILDVHLTPKPEAAGVVH